MIKYQMSFVEHPVSNCYPTRVVTPFDVYQLVHGPRYADETMTLRSLATEEEQRTYKQANLDAILSGGVFSYTNDNSMIKASGLVCLDLDDIDDVEALKQKLLNDKLFDTILLFRSPRGRGLKWFIGADLTKCDYRQWYMSVRNYLMKTYGLTEKQVDPLCANPSRRCWLCHDIDVYLRTDLIENFSI